MRRNLQEKRLVGIRKAGTFDSFGRFVLVEGCQRFVAASLRVGSI